VQEISRVRKEIVIKESRPVNFGQVPWVGPIGSHFGLVGAVKINGPLGNGSFMQFFEKYINYLR